mmetsp:Transcript_43216/g.84479  ORF Transcript_43216/g.84479 Transcript_43216/m.84479 type:complete len:98 (+) Transcript_43216:414-707(+)
MIKTFATSNYGVKPPFYMMAKVDVNGDNAHPLWTRLKTTSKSTFLSTIGGTGIKWNFSKFLIHDGDKVKRFEPSSMPNSLRKDIEQALKEAEKASKA